MARLPDQTLEDMRKYFPTKGSVSWSCRYSNPAGNAGLNAHSSLAAR